MHSICAKRVLQHIDTWPCHFACPDCMSAPKWRSDDMTDTSTTSQLACNEEALQCHCFHLLAHICIDKPVKVCTGKTFGMEVTLSSKFTLSMYVYDSMERRQVQDCLTSLCRQSWRLKAKVYDLMQRRQVQECLTSLCRQCWRVKAKASSANSSAAAAGRPP